VCSRSRVSGNVCDHAQVRENFCSMEKHGKYVPASTLTAAVLHFLPHPTTIVLTLSKVGDGVGAYASLSLAIDVEARELVASIWHEIKGIFGGFGSRD
jgi:hypothetical protein